MREVKIVAWVLFNVILLLAAFKWGTVVGEPPVVVAAQGTVERRLHLKLDSRMDTDKPRTFICREAP